MTTRTAARRYARALFDVIVKEQADLSLADQQLASFHDLLKTYSTLEKVLLNPAVPTPRKRDAVAEIIKITEPSPIVGRLLLLLAERDRLVLLPELIETYRERLRAAQGVVRADVTTAAPLDAQRVSAIEASLAKATGLNVDLTMQVDPALIGGMVARLASTVYDGSIQSQLRRMRQRLLEAGA